MLARVLILAVMLACFGCQDRGRTAAPDGNASGAVPVEVALVDGRYRLLRGGEVYRIRGAGAGVEGLEALVAHGGNSFRTWRTEPDTSSGQQLLDRAAALGLTVALCIEIGRERLGFDYSDAQAVARQLEYARGEVLKYKDHPALLAWIIGNEVDHDYTNPAFLDAINDISKMIHELDGRHPTTTALSRFDAERIALLDARAPDLDIVSVQSYGGIVHLPAHLRDAASPRPYWVTEFGTIGHWEVETTAWGAPIEHHSSAKAAIYLKAYQQFIEPFADKVIGAYVFLWGQKQERTPTWYGMFLADGSETEVVDVMHFLWNGAWPRNRAPRIDGMLLDARAAEQDVTLTAGGQYRASVAASDPDGDPLRYRWEIRHESTATAVGGDHEEVPAVIPGLLEPGAAAVVRFSAPSVPGAYRLFVYVYDGQGHAGHANIPFLVTEA